MENQAGRPDGGQNEHERTWMPKRAGGTDPGEAAPQEQAAPAPEAPANPDTPTWAANRRGGSAAPHSKAPGESAGPAPRPSQASAGRAAGRPANGLAQLPQEGQEVFGFRLGAVLGQGSFARVFLAEQTDLARRQVALKVSDLRGDEPATLAQLQHTHIMPIYSCHENARAGLRAVCMPYFGGAPLSRVLRRVWADAAPAHGGQLRAALEAEAGPPPVRVNAAPESEGPAAAPEAPWAEFGYGQAAVWLVARLAEALAHAHGRGVLHRDVKPSNVLLTADGQPMLLDFNVALDLLGTADRVQSLGGTLAYMAPEHLRILAAGDPGRYHEVDHRADVYSLGLVLYELLAGCGPFVQQGTYSPGTEIVASMAQERSLTTPSVRARRPDAPWSLESILRLCLAPDPAQRYQRAEHLAEDCQRFLADLPLRHAPELSLAERARKWSRRHPRFASSALVGAAACLLLVAGGAALAGVRQALTQTRQQLTAAQDEERRSEFRRGTQRTLCLINTAADQHSHRDEGVRLCERTLGLYGVLDRDDWQQAPAWRRLGPAERAELAEDVRELLLLLAWARRRSGEPRQALELLDRAERIDLPPSRALLEERAACLDQLGDAAEAKACRGRAAELSPSDARDFYLLAATHARAGRYDEAIGLLDEALRRNPTHYWSLLQRGICHLEKGKYALAAGDFGACVGAWPEFAWGYFNRGYALGKAGDLAEAVRDYTRALERDPTFLAARLNRGMARLELRQYAGALEDLDAALRGGRDEAAVCLGRGVALEGLGRHAEADAAFEKAKAVGAPAEVMLRLWWVYGFAVSARRPQQAWEAFGKVLERRPDHPEALYGRAMLLTAWKREAEAVRTYDRLLRANPGFVPARRYRAILLARRGDVADAAQDVNRCLEQEPDGGPVLYAAACVAALGSRGGRDAGLSAQAVDLLRRACARGYGREQAATDPDLEAIRKHPKFHEALSGR